MTQQLLKKIGILVLPLIMMVGLINYAIDPARLFHLGKEEQMAQLTLEGKEFPVEANYDERIYQKKVIQGFKQANDVVVLGSSRSLSIGKEVVPTRSFFNSSVSGASLEDYLAIYEMYRERHQLPKTIILTVDPWLLNKNNGQVRYRSVYPEYERMVNVLDARSRVASGDSLYKISQLLSVTYFQNSLMVAARTISRWKYKPVETKPGQELNIKLADGSWQYPLYVQNMINANVTQAAISYTSEKEVYAMRVFSGLNPHLTELFERFIDRMMQDGVKVVLLLVPYHPVAYERMMQRTDTRIMNQCERYFIETARQRNLRVIGSYDPLKLQMSGYDFYDAMHPKRAVIEKLVSDELKTLK